MFINTNSILTFTRIIVVIIVSLLFHSLSLIAQKSYSINTNTGLSSNNLTVIIKDRNNFMWMGSFDGVQKLEGSRVKVYKSAAVDSLSLSSNQAHSLFEDRQGYIWAGTMAGIDRIDPETGVIRHYNVRSRYSSEQGNGYPFSIFQDKKDSIWLTNGGGLFRINIQTGAYNQVEERVKNSYGVYRSVTGYKASYATETGIWIYTVDGMVFYEYSTGKFYSRYNNPLKKNIFDIEAGSKIGANGEMCNDKKGNVYFIERDSILIKFNIKTEKIDSFPFTRPPLSWQCCYALASDYQDNIWIGFRHGGILLFNQARSTFTPIRFEGVNSLIGSNYIYSFAEDYLHRMWVTTNNGAYVIDRYTTGIKELFLSEKKEFTNLQYSTGMFTEDDRGNLYLPFREGGLMVFNEASEKITSYPVEKTHTSYALLYPKYQGKSWIACDGHLNPLTIANDKLKINTKNDLLASLTREPQKRVVWMLEAKGVLFVKAYNTIFTLRNNMAGEKLSTDGFMKQIALSPDSQYLYYVNVQSNICRRNIMTQKEDTFSITPLLQKIRFSYTDSRDIADDGRGNIWITSQNGLIRYIMANHSVETYTTEKGLSNNFAFALCVDRNKNVWVATLGGISRYDAANNKFTTYHYFTSSTYEDGFGSGLLLKNEKVAFHIGNRLIMIDPDSVQIKPIVQKQLRVDEITINGKPTDINKKSFSLRYNQNRLTIKFGLLDFENASKVNYYYNLNGGDSSWTPLGNQSELFFYSLSPGTYLLKVKAVDGSGNPVSNKIKLSFVINLPFWKTWWFITLGILAASALIYFLIQLRIANVRKEEQQKAAFEREASELKAQALRAQMNPHFIFNCLNSIKALIQEDNKQQAVIYLTTFSKLIRNQLSNAEREISLHEELETCRLYTQLEALRFGNKIICVFKIEEAIDTYSLHVPPLILQPFIENAIWHGILPKDGGNVNVSVTDNDGYIQCAIEDNGIGREISIHNKSQTSATYQSKGLKLVQGRLNLHNVITNLGGSIELIDKKDQYGNGTGTLVIVKFKKEA